MTGKRSKRPGSRLLLALALVAGTLGAMYASAIVAGVVMDLLGVVSGPVRLAAKALALAAAVPAGFFLVERLFLAWSSRRPGGTGGGDGPADR